MRWYWWLGAWLLGGAVVAIWNYGAHYKRRMLIVAETLPCICGHIDDIHMAWLENEDVPEIEELGQCMVVDCDCPQFDLDTKVVNPESMLWRPE